MKFLVDANMSPRFAGILRTEGHDAIAVRDLGLADASDDEILDHAISDQRVIISHDTDFGTLLTFSAAQRSFVHFDQIFGIANSGRARRHSPRESRFHSRGPRGRSDRRICAWTPKKSTASGALTRLPG